MLRIVARNCSLMLRESFSQARWPLTSSSHINLVSQQLSIQFYSDLADDRTSQGQQREKRHQPSVKVLYDGECNICMHEIRVLQKLARRKPVDFVDINSPGFTTEAFSGVTYEQAMKEMHVIGADGKVYVQGDAIREMYRACGMGWLAAATQLPGIETACNRMYETFAKYRLEKALDRCESGVSCSVKLKHLRDKLRPQQE